MTDEQVIQALTGSFEDAKTKLMAMIAMGIDLEYQMTPLETIAVYRIGSILPIIYLWKDREWRAH